MSEHNFIFKFKLSADKDLETYLDELCQAGCDDSLVGCGQEGWLAMDFTREAESIKEAVESAIADVRKVMGNSLIEIEYNNNKVYNNEQRRY